MRGLPDHPAARISGRCARVGRRGACRSPRRDTGCSSPYLRGYGPTRFRDAASPRMAEQAAIGQDVIDFADALRPAAIRGGGLRLGRSRGGDRRGASSRSRARGGADRRLYDPEHVDARRRRVRPKPSRSVWYQWYFNTERGRAGLRPIGAHSAGCCGRTWSPTWHFTDETYNSHGGVVRQPGLRRRRDPFLSSPATSTRPASRGSRRWKRQLAQRPKIQAPSITLYGGRRAWLAPPARDAARRAERVRVVGSAPRRSRASGTSCRASGPKRCRPRCWKCSRRRDSPGQIPISLNTSFAARKLSIPAGIPQ